MDLDFLPKDLLYNDSTYKESNRQLLAAIEILEKAQSQKEKNVKVEEKNEGFWSKVGKIFTPFKCGQNND